MPVANHNRVRLFARKRTNECNANAMRICERQIHECVYMWWDNAHFNAQRWCAGRIRYRRAAADHSVIN